MLSNSGTVTAQIARHLGTVCRRGARPEGQPAPAPHRPITPPTVHDDAHRLTLVRVGKLGGGGWGAGVRSGARQGTSQQGGSSGWPRHQGPRGGAAGPGHRTRTTAPPPSISLPGPPHIGVALIPFSSFPTPPHPHPSSPSTPRPAPPPPPALPPHAPHRVAVRQEGLVDGVRVGRQCVQGVGPVLQRPQTRLDGLPGDHRLWGGGAGGGAGAAGRGRRGGGVTFMIN